MRHRDLSNFRSGATLGATKSESRKTHRYGRGPLARGRATVSAKLRAHPFFLGDPYARHGLAEERAGLPANRGGRGGGSMARW